MMRLRNEVKTITTVREIEVTDQNGLCLLLPAGTELRYAETPDRIPGSAPFWYVELRDDDGEWEPFTSDTRPSVGGAT